MAGVSLATDVFFTRRSSTKAWHQPALFPSPKGEGFICDFNGFPLPTEGFQLSSERGKFLWHYPCSSPAVNPQTLRQKTRSLK